MLSLLQTLMERDGLTDAEAQLLIDEAREQLHTYLDTSELGLAHDICEEMFGLEPDYLDDLMTF